MNAHSPPAPTHDDSIRRNQDLVARIEKSQLFRDYRTAFQTATGLPLVLRAAGSFSPPLSGSKQMNPFCALMVGRSKTCSACLQMQQRVEQEAVGESKTLECFAGLTESVVPVRLVSYSVEEQLFSTRLYPIRAKVSVSMQVLTDQAFPARGENAQSSLAAEIARAAYHYTSTQRKALAVLNGGNTLHAILGLLPL